MQTVILEEWRPVVGWEPFYEVSSCGRVRRKKDGREKKRCCGDHGYYTTQLSFPRKKARVHRLVAEAFIPNADPNSRPLVNHIDNNPLNNHADNLEWCSQRENLDHMTRLGRRAAPNIGVRPANSKLTDDQVNAVKCLRGDGLSLAKIGAMVGISKKGVLRICQGKSYANNNTPQR
jgi:hypothetical protein